METLAVTASARAPDAGGGGPSPPLIQGESFGALLDQIIGRDLASPENGREFAAPRGAGKEVEPTVDAEPVESSGEEQADGRADEASGADQPESSGFEGSNGRERGESAVERERSPEPSESPERVVRSAGREETSESAVSDGTHEASSEAQTVAADDPSERGAIASSHGAPVAVPFVVPDAGDVVHSVQQLAEMSKAAPESVKLETGLSLPQENATAASGIAKLVGGEQTTLPLPESTGPKPVFQPVPTEVTEGLDEAAVPIEDVASDPAAGDLEEGYDPLLDPIEADGDDSSAGRDPGRPSDEPVVVARPRSTAGGPGFVGSQSIAGALRDAGGTTGAGAETPGSSVASPTASSEALRSGPVSTEAMRLHPGLERQEFIQRIVRMAQATRQGERATARLWLKPPELGSVRASVSIENGVVTARLAVETESARQALLSEVSSLSSQLEERGLKVDSVQVHLFGDARRENASEFARGRRDGRADPARDEVAEGAEEAEAIPERVLEGPVGRIGPNSVEIWV